MKSADHIKRLYQRATLDLDDPSDRMIRAKILEAHRFSQENSSGHCIQGFWRIVMRKPIISLSIVTLVIAGSAICMRMLTETSNVALAHVLTRLDQVEAYSYQIKATIAGPAVDPQAAQQEIRYTVLFSDAWGAKMTIDGHHPLVGTRICQEMYFLPRSNLYLTLLPEQKKYAQTDLDEDTFSAMRGSHDPRLMINTILTGEHTALGPDTIDGLKVEGFQGSDPNLMGGDGSGPASDVKIWVDIQTELPVRIEIDTLVADTMHIRQVMYDFQWHRPIEPTVFEPNIPDDYTPDGHPLIWIRPKGKAKPASGEKNEQTREVLSKLAQMPANEETAVKALQIFMELGGDYPQKLDMNTIVNDLARIYKSDLPGAVALRKKVAALTKSERGQFSIDKMLPQRGLVLFYESLVKDQRDVAYHGGSVTTRDADLPLLRWRATDKQYRVIFGDLHTETLDKERLTELEGGLAQ